MEETKKYVSLSSGSNATRTSTSGMQVCYFAEVCGSWLHTGSGLPGHHSCFRLCVIMRPIRENLFSQGLFVQLCASLVGKLALGHCHLASWILRYPQFSNNLTRYPFHKLYPCFFQVIFGSPVDSTSYQRCCLFFTRNLYFLTTSRRPILPHRTARGWRRPPILPHRIARGWRRRPPTARSHSTQQRR